MVKGGFRHLVVVKGHDVEGLLSMRDIVRCWNIGRAAQAAAGHDVAVSPSAGDERRGTAGSRVWVTNGCFGDGLDT